MRFFDGWIDAGFVLVYVRDERKLPLNEKESSGEGREEGRRRTVRIYTEGLHNIEQQQPSERPCVCATEKWACMAPRRGAAKHVETPMSAIRTEVPHISINNNTTNDKDARRKEIKKKERGRGAGTARKRFILAGLFVLFAHGAIP